MARAKVNDIAEERKADRKLLAIEVDGRTVTCDSRSLTIRETQLLRAELAKIGVEPSADDWFAGVLWITLRRDDPALTFAEVCDSLTVGAVRDSELIDAEADTPEA